MTGYSEQSLFFIPIPDLKKLYSVFLSFRNLSSHADEGELRNRQVKTCREVLRLHSDVIASPVLGRYGGIRVIMAMAFFQEGVIQAYAQSHGLQIGSPERVLPSILQLCLSYSLTARLAPNWNRAGRYLIAGKDFLSVASKRIAVVLELSVNETQLCVSVEASTVRLPPVTLKDFDVPALVIERFLNNREIVFHTKTPNNWCYVLPSMKKGQVISISHRLPPECPFQTYAELGNHWNSMGAGGNWATVGRRSRGGRRVRRQREKRKGKGRELADMMERRKVDILCVQETRWKGSKARSIGAGFKLFYYGVDSKRNGVGVVLKEEFVRNVLEVGCELEEKESFWSELDEVMESIPTGERVVIGADFNGHVGEGNTGDEEVMGKFGVKERNLEGQMVVDFAKRMDMGVVNTYFQKREEHRVTYKSGGRRTQIEKKTKWWKLKKEECCEEFRQKLRQALGGQVVLPDDWETTAEVIRETGRKVLGVSSGRRKEDKETWWWNEEVQDSVQRKRLAKKKWDMDRTEENRQEYKELQRRVKREVSKAKQKAYEELYTRLDTREGEKDLYRLARQGDRDGKDVQQVRVIKDRDGRVLTSEQSVQRRWKEYFEELMNEENEREKRVEGVNSVEQKVDNIRKDEVRKALKRMKSGKAVGPDDIPVEYGYYLPPLNEDEVVYCSVYFKPLGEKLFTTFTLSSKHITGYPLCCIRIQPVQCFPRVNLQGALTAFISDARSLMENVCGFTAQMTSKPCYYTTNLSRPSLQDSGVLPATLTSKSSSRLVLTQLPNVFPLERVPLQHLESSPWPLSQPVGHSSIRHPATTNGHGNPQIPDPILQSSHCHDAETCQFPSSFTSLPSFSFSSSVSANHPLLSNTQPATQRPKLVPIFTNKSLSRHVNITKILAEKKKLEVTKCDSRAAVNRSSFSPLSSSSSLPRVSLPFFKDRKRDHNACTTDPAQPLFQTQPARVIEIAKTRGEVFESLPKKVRVIQDVDVVKYARSNQLAKINAATLQAWLKGQGITVRSKDKKEDLMSKVMQSLSEP
ncbi:hypothetical protein QTP70_031499 [Hemibagrus guttatus]|uniref:Uncharacterized protein n=1 Tax=Hemibagrus guttatus TaxID=175788 RepID=A0AAE0RFM3_9TELE|nr:hypothetical protein QTP70_031499 [Hemibagrus guttatus]